LLLASFDRRLEPSGTGCLIQGVDQKRKGQDMTHLQKRIEAERRVAKRSFTMLGIVTKRNFFGIRKSFGLRKAIRVLFSTHTTALAILMS
jgi:hypothetical protein